MSVPAPKRMHSSFSSHCAWKLQLSTVRCLSQRHLLAQTSWLNWAIKEPGKPQRVCHHGLCRAPRTQAPTTSTQQLCRGGGGGGTASGFRSVSCPLRYPHLPVIHQLVSATVVTQVKGPSLCDAFGVGPICHHPMN